MHEDLERLDRLDRLDRDRFRQDLKIKELRSEHEALRATLGEQEAVLGARQGAVDENATGQRGLQRKLSDYRNSRASAVRLLETGQGDAEAAQRQIDRCEALIDETETELLELLEQADALEALVSEASAAVAASRERLAQLDGSVPEEIAKLQASMASLTEQRRALIDTLPRELVSRYEHWRARGKWAVSRIVGKTCDACRMEVQPQHRSDLRRGRIAPCRGCHRYLIPDEG